MNDRILPLVEGVVVDTSDPQQMGRVKVWVPSIDGSSYDVALLPWARYVSPLAGQTRDFASGATSTVTPGLQSYGFWAVPKEGALVLIGFLYNDPNQRIYMGSYFRDHGNRSLPQGRNRPDIGAKTPVSDTLDPVQPQSSNLEAQFGGNLDAPQARTRGAYERQVAQDKTEKDGAEGYQKGVKPNVGLDPQTYCLTTPGHHSIIMQDNPATSRLRLKTASGQQVIFDDANERIYISTARGNTWLELDQDGHVHIHAAESFSVGAGADINFTAGGNINLQAGKSINVASGAALNLSACKTININGEGVNLTSGGAFNILASGDLLQTAPNIHLNGPSATEAACADVSTALVPKHEPWTRPASKQTRNSNWKE